MNESNNAKNETSSSSKTAAEIRVDVFGRTDVGLVREHNEDNFLIADLTAGNRNIRPEVRQHTIGKHGSIFVVCDGRGGAAAGEVASQIAVDTIYDMMQSGEPPNSEEALAQRLEKAICEAGRRILTAAKINRAQRGMGTTVTAAALIGPRLLVGQVGDSRAYILRGNQFVQITKDQSLVQQLIDAKQMTEEEARSFDKNNIILQALGTSEEVHVDMTSVVLKNGDQLVLCSDGLCGLVDNEAIGRITYNALNPLEACRVLTETACEGGGYDNITVIVAAFEGDRLEEAPEGNEFDDSLFYNQYSFSRTQETTARKVRPSQPSSPRNAEEPTDARSLEELPATISPVPPKPKSSGMQLRLVGIFGIVLLAFTGIVTFLGGQDETPTLEETEKTETSDEIPASAPKTPKDAPKTAQPPSSMVNTTEETSPTASESLPTLAPTPEEAITKKERKKRMNEETSKLKQNDGIDTSNEEADLTHASPPSVDHDKSGIGTPAKTEPTDKENASPKKPDRFKSHKNPYEEAPEPLPKKDPKKSQDTSGETQDAPSPKPKGAELPKPIDENPFGST
jgi:PPM family protein phosphatase